jgi:outer membrane protein OmpU
MTKHVIRGRYSYLLGSTALMGLQALASPAAASDGVKLSLGGFLYNAFGATFDDDGAGEAGDNVNTVGVGHDGEIQFEGAVTLDNGVTVGARFDLEAGDEDGDQFDQSYGYFSGGWGEIRIGLVDGAAGSSYMLPPGSTSNFGPYSPNTIGAVLSPGLFDPENTITVRDKPIKVVYYSPTWSGFSFGVSFTPNDDEKAYNDGDNVDGSWRANKPEGSASNNVGLNVHYEHQGENWGIVAGAAAYIEGDVNKAGPEDAEQAGYNAGVNLNFGAWTFGVAGTYFTNENGQDQDLWLIGTGFTYAWDAWTLGAGWAHGTRDVAGFSDDDQLDRAGVTANYAMAPGISLDAGIFYTWAEAADDADDPNDNYDAIEFSVGSALEF